MTEDRHSSSPAPAAPRRISLADALRENWLEIWYQPKIDLRRKCLVGAEALARIRHPAYGLLWPEDFLPSLDDQELAHLAEQGIKAALTDWTKFAAAGFNLRLAVNLPVRALCDAPIAALVDARRPRASDWPGLILEVSEGQIVREVALVQRVAPALKAAGIALSIDDFGAGYSSFSSLRHLPFAELKLDPSFVRNCATDPDNAAICQTAIDLAHRFGSVAVAEGIETMADLQALGAMGCDFGQGMMIAAPAPKAHLLSLLYERAKTARPPARSQPAAACVV
ncbi:MAG TPA: EAL domain-containing protein [Pseudolabrys sp.]|nr:EAL domain-containing protein [Pseudolabrys sp.]